MDTTNIPCVYFLRHKNTSPIKIGFCSSNTPKSRELSANTYSPWGVEILGYINCFDAKKVENKLHYHFRQYRLNGEWFEISYDMILEYLNVNKIESIDCNKSILSPSRMKFRKAKRKKC